MASINFAEDAKALLRKTFSNYDEHHGLGAMSVAAYDTAWVSLVTKTIDGRKQWLFPESFQHLLATQSHQGGWALDSGAQIDGILNTAGPLLALKRYVAEPLQLQHNAQVLAGRIEKATVSLRSQLADWDVSTTNHVGFEIIVPAMLDLLEKEDPSLVFDFEAKETLLKIYNAKMSRFRPEALYGPTRLTALHSLESFIGKIDFDKVKHHKVRGSLMGSPSSTAAYLLNASQWDDESEAYLRHVIQFAAGQSSGGVPSAFPSTHFECTWILSTLFRAGFTPSDLEGAELTKVTEILSDSFNKENGVLGFAPSFEADVDDTAKTISTLNVLGRTVSPESMIKTFEADTHFRTYVGERDPSATANSNALLALLHQPDVSKYSSQILKITKFLSDTWWTSDGKIDDKWNICHLYPSVLLVEAFVDVLQLIEQKKLSSEFDEDLQSKVAVAVFQACFRPLLDQKADGSWNQSVEETAYAILILTEARRLAFFERIAGPLNDAITRGVAYINSISHRPLNYIWIEKVSYASPLLTDAYVIAALKAASSEPGPLVGRSLWPEGYMTHLDKYVKNFWETPLFQSNPYWEMEGSMIESALFLPLLRKQRLVVFPFDDAEDIKYFDMLPMFWTCTNNRKRTYAPTTFLYELGLLSLLVFQIDEFMEDVCASLFVGQYPALRHLINSLFDKADPADINGKSIEYVDVSKRSKLLGSTETVTYDSVVHYLKKFRDYLELHPAVANASAWDKEMLHRELRVALLAHAQQAEDSSRYNHDKLPDGKVRKPTSEDTFFTWVRTTSADHVGSTYAFYFVSCILGASHSPGNGPGEDCFGSGEEKYLANAVMRHMATMCRMYNDLASAERDNAEGSLNCVDFPEFDDAGDLAARKKAVFDVLDFETFAFENAFGRLRQAGKNTASKRKDREAARLSERRLNIIEFFADQMDLYGQVWCNADRSRPLPGV
nr:SonA [Paraconiothyrium archidendri]